MDAKHGHLQVAKTDRWISVWGRNWKMWETCLTKHRHMSHQAEKGETHVSPSWDTCLTKLKKVRHMSHLAETHVSPSWKGETCVSPSWDTCLTKLKNVVETLATWIGHNHCFEARNHHNMCTMQGCLKMEEEEDFTSSALRSFVRVVVVVVVVVVLVVVMVVAVVVVRRRLASRLWRMI